LLRVFVAGSLDVEVTTAVCGWHLNGGA